MRLRMDLGRNVLATIALVLALAACGSVDGTGGLDEDVGAQLACEAVRENWAKVAADPTAYPGEAGEIIGYVQSADDPGLQRAAAAFDRDPSSRTWKRFRTRCEELGLG